MRRGRIVIYLVLIFVIGLVVLLLFLRNRGSKQVDTPQATPTVSSVSVVIAGQNISSGAQITADMLTTIQIPQDMWLQSYYTDVNVVIGQYAKYPLEQSMFITSAMISQNLNMGGSTWSTVIPPGMSAVAVPVTRLSSVAYGIRDGDRVDVIVSMLMVELDTQYQSITPNYTAGVLAANGVGILIGGGSVEDAKAELNDKSSTETAQVVSGGLLGNQGRVEQDPTLQTPFYIIPSERQRPRMVSQMIIKNVQVLHVGTFKLPGEEDENAVTNQVGEGTPSPTPDPGQVVIRVIEKPDIITLIVTPQDAVTLTYLLYTTGTNITFTLRNPNDNGRYDTEAATLAFILGQYNIPVPVKLGYGLEPRLDDLLKFYYLPLDNFPTPTPDN